MSRSYKIQQPIKDLATLRQEKQLLREHIKASDLRMKQTVREWPLTTALNVAQKVGHVLFQNNLTSMATGLLGFKSGKKGFMPSLIKATLMFAGTQLVKYFTKGKSDIEEEIEEDVDESESVDESIQESEPNATAD
jgi:hypothetical protein